MTPAPTYRIHPAVGIARLGNSPDSFYIAPESRGAAPIDCGPDGIPTAQQPVRQFKDGQNRIRRQAARFRIYVYDDQNRQGRELKLGDVITAAQVKGGRRTGELLTGTLADIQWTVYPANKKASWWEFQQLEGERGYSSNHPLRNASIEDASHRQKLVIDPGPRTVSWANPKSRAAVFDRGTAPGTPESFPPSGLQPHAIDTLGKLMSVTDGDGYNRLLVLGGLGNSGSVINGFTEPSIQNYANNDGWFDDTSDGPVTASLVMKVDTIDGVPAAPGTTASIPVDESAWVITGYPRYAPQIVDIITMDDLVYDVAIRDFAYDPLIYANGQYNKDYYPYFWRDIWPILERPFSYQFVADIDSTQGGDPHQSGPKSQGNFDPDILSIPPHAGEDPQQQKNNCFRRRLIWEVLRKIGQENRLYADHAAPGRVFYAMPLLCGDNPLSNDVPSKFLRLTDTTLFLIHQWAIGKFINEKMEDIQPPALPPGIALDRGVLGNALGGAFCPGGEASWIMRNPAIYSSAYRIHRAPAPVPGSLSQPSAVNGADVTADISAGLEPGDLTKYGPVPWQADFNECTNQDIDVTYEQWSVLEPGSTGDPVKQKTWLTYWWPSHRPVYVPSPGKGMRMWSPTPNSHEGDLTMVSIWWQLGFVIPAPDWTAETPDFQLSENQLGG
jgi:hypothetical protein